MIEMSISKKNSLSIVLLVLLSVVLILNWQDGNTTRMLLLSICVFSFVPFWKYKSSHFTVLLLFTIFYAFNAFFTGFKSSFVDLLYCSLPGLSLFLMGSYLGDVLSEDRLERAILTTLFSYTSVVIFLSFVDIFSTGQIINYGRAIFVNSDEEVVLVGDRLILSVGVIGLPLFFFHKTKYRLLYFIIAALSILSAIHYIHRTPLIVCIICFSIAFIFSYKNNKKLLNILFLLIFIASVCFLGLFSNDEIVSAYSERNNVDASTMGDRWPRWIDALGKLFEYPFGWFNDKHTMNTYVHNMWLDVARTVGLLPFILLVAFSIKGFLVSLKGRGLFVLFLLLDVSFLFSCLVEPVFEAYPTHAWIYMLFLGMKIGYSRQVVHNT